MSVRPTKRTDASKIEQSALIRFLTVESVSAVYINRLKRNVYEDNYISLSQAKKWSKRFRHGERRCKMRHGRGQADRVIGVDAISQVDILIG